MRGSRKPQEHRPWVASFAQGEARERSNLIDKFAAQRRALTLSNGRDDWSRHPLAAHDRSLACPFRSTSLLAPAGPLVGPPGPPPTSRRSFDPLGPVVLFWVHCCLGAKPACSNRLQVSGRMLLRPSSPAGVSRNELHFSLSASFRLCGASCVVGLVVCGSRAAGRLPGICPSNPAAAYIAGIAKPVFEPFSIP